jgi:Na+/H+ antiporter NhaC
MHRKRSSLVGDFGLISALPFALALFFLIWKEDLVFPVLGGLFIGSIIASKFNPYNGFINTFGALVNSALFENTNILTLVIVAEILILFSLLGVNGTLSAVTKTLAKRLVEKNRLEIAIAVSNAVVFIDRHLSSLLVGVFTKPFVEKKKLHPLKHSYLLNAVTSPLASLVPFTTLTPLILVGIGSAFAGLGMGFSPMKAFLRSLPYQYYNIFSLFIVLSTILLEKDVFLMKRYRDSALPEGFRGPEGSHVSFGCSSVPRKTQDSQRAFYGFIGTIALVFAFVVIGLVLGRAGMREGRIPGLLQFQTIFTTSLFAGIVCALVYSFATKSTSYTELREKRSAVPKPYLAALFYLVLVLAVEAMAAKLAVSTSLMGFLAAGTHNPRSIPLLVFLFSSVISFLSGSMPFTVATVMPLAIRLVSHNMTDPLIVDSLLFAVIGAVLSGASFGDMNSPFSVNFILASAAAETSVTGHFRSQIGYAAIAFVVTIVAGYLLLMLNLKPYLSLSSGALLIGLVFFGLNREK